ncbi:tetratricopeptide repeat-containing protein, partial [Cardiosporidium cionae]
MYAMSSHNVSSDAFLKKAVAELNTNGTSDSLQSLLSSMDFPTLKYALTHAREVGNKAFHEKRYEEAIEYYTQVLAGRNFSGEHMELQHQMVSTLSNRSACFLALKDYARALQDAKECIQLDASWSKSWYRAARTLFEMQCYEDAEKVFRASLKYSQSTNSSQINVWIEKSSNLAQKTKLIQRSIVDYNRFDHIGEEEAAEDSSAITDVQPYVEFSDEVSLEKRKSLEQMLLGKGGSANTTTDMQPFTSLPYFNPESLFQEWPEISSTLIKDAAIKKKKKEENEAILGICNYLQLKSEASAAKRAYEQLETSLPQKWANGLKRRLLFHFDRKSARKEENSPNSAASFSLQDFHILFLGTGSGLPLIIAAQTLKTLSEEAEEVPTLVSSLKTINLKPSLDPIPPTIEGESTVQNTVISSLSQSSSSSFTSSFLITACTDLPSGATLATLRLLTTVNAVNDSIYILPKRIESLTSASTSLNSYENSLKDLPKPASMLVLDPILFDEGIIGKRLLHSVRYARQNVCHPLPIVFPNRMIVYIQGYSIQFPKDSLFDFSSMDEFRWSPYFDVIDLRSEANFTVLTEPKAVFEFQFDGPLEDLEK